MYALCILAGIFFAIWYTTRRWVERGGNAEVVGSVAFWAVPFGIIGGRLYHLITSPDQYFGEGGHPIDAFKIWNGGLGIWGAVALGALGAYIGCRRQGVSFVTFMDAAAPAVLVAQAIGRLGNYFNQELFGKPTHLPWGLWVDVQYRPDGFEVYNTFHPTFLYELVWNLLGAALIVYLDRRFDLRGGRVFWLYVMVYTAGRSWIEMMRIDDAHHFFGIRVNVFVSIVALVASTIIFFWLGARQRRQVERVPRHLLAATTAGGDPSATEDGGDPPETSADAPAEGSVDA
jgi:prolipoprotein diacylglyceryl transferase